MQVITNNHNRPIIYFFELPENIQEERKDDYEGIEDSSFFLYKGYYYDLNDFMRNNENTPFGNEWHGYLGESYFSAILIKLDDTGESVKVGMIYS